MNKKDKLIQRFCNLPRDFTFDEMVSLLDIFQGQLTLTDVLNQDIPVLNALKEADLIIFSMGSLYTSVLPNIICKEVEDVLNETKAPIMYTCNIVTQPGETDNFTVGDHVKLLNRYLDKKKVDVVIANNAKIEEEIAKRYESQEQKDPVLIDYEELEKIGVELIEDNLLTIDDNTLKHDSLKLSSLIFSYLMRK